jgi:hypothetical protein
MLQRPNAVGLILCEQVVIAEKTRNATLVNSFGRLRFKAFPSPPQRFVVHAVLTDGLGDAKMSLVVSRLDTLEDIAEYRWSMQFADPLRDVRLVLRLPGLSFPQPVRYQFALSAADEWIAQCVLQVIAEEDQS